MMRLFTNEEPFPHFFLMCVCVLLVPACAHTHTHAPTRTRACNTVSDHNCVHEHCMPLPLASCGNASVDTYPLDAITSLVSIWGTQTFLHPYLLRCAQAPMPTRSMRCSTAHMQCAIIQLIFLAQTFVHPQTLTPHSPGTNWAHPRIQ